MLERHQSFVLAGDGLVVLGTACIRKGLKAQTASEDWVNEASCKLKHIAQTHSPKGLSGCCFRRSSPPSICPVSLLPEMPEHPNLAGLVFGRGLCLYPSVRPLLSFLLFYISLYPSSCFPANTSPRTLSLHVCQFIPVLTGQPCFLASDDPAVSRVPSLHSFTIKVENRPGLDCLLLNVR